MTEQNSRGVAWLVIGASVATSLALYYELLFIKPCFDDWPWIQSALDVSSSSSVREFIVNLCTPTGVFWRPLNVLPQLLGMGETIWLTQIVKLFLIVIVAFGCMFWARRFLTLPLLSAAVITYFLIHQSLILPLEPDYWGDVFCLIAFVGVAGLSYSAVDQGLNTRKTIAVMGLTCVAVLSKEAGVAILGIPATVFAVYYRDISRTTKQQFIFLFFLLILILGAYFGVRDWNGVGINRQEDSHYSLSIRNVIQNLGLLAIGLSSPVDTIKVVLDGPIYKLMAGLWTLIIGTLIVFGFRYGRLQERKWILMFVLYVVVCQGATLFVPRLSEGNISHSLPFAAILVFLSVQILYRRYRPQVTSFGFAVWILWIVLSVMAVRHKTAEVARLHDEAYNFRELVMSEYPNPPSRNFVVVAESAQRGYSIFVQPLEFSLPGEVYNALPLLYGDSTLVMTYVTVSDFTQLSDSLRNSHVFVDKNGRIFFRLVG